MVLLAVLLIVIVGVWALERFYLRGEKIKTYPTPTESGIVSTFARPDGPGPATEAVVNQIKALTGKMSAAGSDRVKTGRIIIDSMTNGIDYASTFTSVDADGVKAEWVVAPGADSSRRVLYIHGGGFIMGSPKSHRTITNRFSEISGCAVLSIDYRLQPEHKHMDAVSDCRTAYRWILDNGPNGPENLKELFIAGDSAGGNLSLSLVAWIRDNHLHAPDAVVALSPLTDTTFSGNSVRSNEATDIMLAPAFKPLLRQPQFIKSLYVLWAYGLRPSNPVVSPLRGNLSGLPPTLVQASDIELLLDDSTRYVNKAYAAGSPVKLQIWADMMHVWQFFDPQIPQAIEAWAEIGKFLESHRSD